MHPIEPLLRSSPSGFGRDVRSDPASGVRRDRSSRWLGPWLLLLGLLAVGLPGAGCRLVELRMPGEPMPKDDFALRGQTREFAAAFSSSVQNLADTIARQTNDMALRSRCAQWKIGAAGAMRSAVLRSTPRLALLDAWTFSRQMNAFLDGGKGDRLFGPFQAMVVTNSQVLERRITAIARTVLPASEFSKMDTFIAGHVGRFPLQSLAFDRESVVARWEELEGKPTRVPPAGTGSEALSDVAERLQIVGQQIPDELRWRISLETERLETELARTGLTLNLVETNLQRIAEAAGSSPGMLTNAVLDLRLAFLPVLEQFQAQWGTTTRTLQTERQALTATLAAERAVVLKAVDDQRAAVMRETQAMVHDVVDRSLTEVRRVVRDVLFYGLLLSVVILGVPFLLGFLVGRAAGRARVVRQGSVP